jgi:hypothetical protein
MKKVCLLSLLVMTVSISFGQSFSAVNWVNWANEPDYEDSIGYAEHPYNYEVASIPQRSLTVMDAGTFDAAWDQLPEAYNISKVVSDAGGDLYDIGSGNTFGGQWKAFHDGYVVYFMLKYYDTGNQVDEGTLTFEIMPQIAGYNEELGVFRHEPTFEKGVADNNVSLQNMAYARYVELGGGKTWFDKGEVTSHDCSIGNTGQWGRNQVGFDAFANVEDLMLWVAADGITRAVLPMDFDTETSVLSYPVDEYLPDGARAALQIGDVFSLDVKSNAKVGGANVSFCWSSDKNNVYASNYYAGQATLEVVSNVSEVASATKDLVYFANDVVYVKGNTANLEVFNITGTKVLSVANASALSLSNLSNGVYIVRVNGQGSVKVVKR